MKRTDKKQPPLKRPPKKEKKRKKLRLDAAAQEEGRLLGQYKAHSKKPLLESAKEHLGRMLDSINPLDVVAILGTTCLIKLGIEASESLTAMVVRVYEKHQVRLKATPRRESLMWEGPKDIMVGLFPEGTSAFLLEAFGAASSEALEWAISFVAAYMLVKHGGELLGLGQNLSALVGMLLA